MAETTGISWTRSTFNPWIGCTKVGPGCDHCYAAVSTPARAMKIEWGAGKPRRHTSESIWRQPGKWNHEQGELIRQQKPYGLTPPPWYVFCASLADVFDNEVEDVWRAEVWATIMATPNLTWQLVTKRVGNVMKMIPTHWRQQLPANVWIIATVVNQEEFDRDWPKLRAVPARVRGLSIEPMLGPITFPDDVRGELHWAIYGGESKQGGAAARPCDVMWIVDGIVQCREFGIAPFVKQLGHAAHGNGAPLKFNVTGKGADPKEWPNALRVQEFPA